jgi:FkbM family methyltransferase
MNPDRSASAASEVASILATLLDEPIVIADVGCRWGFADTWEQLGERCRAIGFEPDERECERLRKRYRDHTTVEIVAHALGSEAGPATLYVTREPACSSVYRPLDDVIDRQPIELITLYDWCRRSGVDRIDVVKVDTQGSELDVLRGAVRSLDNVVAVETEVEFNRMYEGQPLFGDLDRFLRDHGFVLWSLDNLSHHRQRGARSGLRQSKQLFDFDDARFSSRSGQLFWADALFIRADVALPQPATPWRDALRHACVTAALGLNDLAGLTLDLHYRTLQGEDRETIEAARALLPEPDRETEWVTAVVGLDAHEGPPAVELGSDGVLDEDLFVELGEPIDGAGWREPHRFGSALGRWTGPGAQAWIDIPIQVPPSTRIEWSVAAMREGDAGATIGVDVNGVPLEVDRTAHDGGFVLTGVVPGDYRSERRFTRVSIRTPDAVPMRGTPDPRKISLGVTELRLLVPPRRTLERGEGAHEAPPHQHDG